MRFQTSAAGVSFEIPDDWWLFAEMERVYAKQRIYPYSHGWEWRGNRNSISQ